jgi:hypothetical protein
MQTRKMLCAILAGVGVIAGCQSTDQMLDQQQAQAIEVGLQRGRFDFNCPAAQAQVLSREVVQPPMGAVRLGVERAEYTLGIEGCGQRRTMVVLCPLDGGGCFAGGNTQ